MQVQSLGQEDPLEEDIATHFSMLVWRTPRTEQPGGLQSMGSQRVGHDWSDFTCMHSRPIRKIKWDNENEGLPLCSSCQDSSVILVFWVKAMFFSSGHVWMWELDCEESWALKNWCFWTVMLEKTLKSPLDCEEIQPVHPKGNQSWIFIERTDAEAETLELWPPDAKNQLIGKDPDAGKDWRPEEKRTTEDEMAGWHHWLDGH